jgi:Arc/MetJ-type ribon-helix-helix transcriptional regulator
MYQTLNLSERLYQQLEATARSGGFDSIEEFIQKLIELWQARVEELRRRQEQVRRIDALREQLAAKYGTMNDSVPLIRADRER